MFPRNYNLQVSNMICGGGGGGGGGGAEGEICWGIGGRDRATKC